jgi:Cytochrome C'
MNARTLVVSSGLVAAAVAGALFLRPSRTLHRGPEMAPPARLPPAARAVIATKMGRHAQQLNTLLMSVLVLDDDGVARIAGEIFDEPQLARPVAGDELNGLLPEGFFQLQDAMRAQAREVVAVAARHDRARLPESFAQLTKTCVSCHALYLGRP